MLLQNGLTRIVSIWHKLCALGAETTVPDRQAFNAVYRGTFKC